MIRKIRIENYKSISNLTLELGRVTVLIGPNGSGKSNILEAIALASAASQQKLDNEFLISRGIRVTENGFMRSAFEKVAQSDNEKPLSESMAKKAQRPDDPIHIFISGDGRVHLDGKFFVEESTSYPKWKYHRILNKNQSNQLTRQFKLLEQGNGSSKYRSISDIFTNLIDEWSGSLPDFLIYAPENSALRSFQTEGQILPLGVRGEGLFAHLKSLKLLKNSKSKKALETIGEKLTLIDWFEAFDIPDDLAPGERSIRIRDRFLPDGRLFDQRSANEGFLYLLFYLTLFISPDTPAFFSIDNVDNSLNPKLCGTLLTELIGLAKANNKQVILTTHNPAVLDGLDLHDDEQRLLVVDRNKNGHTRVHRVGPPKPPEGQLPLRLSEAFLRGYIGGLPKNF